MSEKEQAEREREVEFVMESAAPRTSGVAEGSVEVVEGEGRREMVLWEMSQDERETEEKPSAERAADGLGRLDS